MSYILEALKKSQAERELGRVPTLDAAGLFEEDKIAPRRPPWVLVAVGLAAASLSIALYALWRDPGRGVAGPAGTLVAQPTGQPAGRPADPSPAPSPAPAPRPRPDPEGPGRSTSPPPAGAPAGGLALGRGGATGWDLPAGGDSPPSDRDPFAPGSLAPRPSRPVTVPVPAGYGRSSGSSAPLVEAPPRKGSAGPSPPVFAAPAPAPFAPGGRMPQAQGGDGLPQTEAELDAILEAELERQLALDSDTDPQAIAEPLDAAPADPVPTPVPRELIADIEAFKDELRKGAPKTRAAPPPPAGAARDPKALRLTPDQQAGLPAFLMTVHVYDRDKSRRFVLINGLKYREGDKTREGLGVQQILPDGAVLDYGGNAFYLAR